MKKDTYSKILMAPLFMLLAVACSPNQFNQTTEYDDVYFTSADRSAVKKQERQAQQAVLDHQREAATLESYSSQKVDEKIVEKYNNGAENTVTYFEEGPLVKTAADLNYDDFVADYENQQLAFYELPLDWDTDWDRLSFNSLMEQDFSFRLAWYDQYYLGQNLRMTQYLSGRTSRLNNRGAAFGRPTVGLAAFNNFNPGFGFANTQFIDINTWGPYDPFWTPIPAWGFGWNNGWGWNRGLTVNIGFGWGWNRWNRWNRGWGWGWNDPFWCPPFNGWGWRGGWNNNVFVRNNIIVDRRVDRILDANTRSQDVRRGPRVGTRNVATVRNDAINGSAPRTRSSRYVDNLEGSRSSAASSRSGRANSGRSVRSDGATSTTRTGRAGVTNGRNNRVRTDAYRYEGGNSNSRNNRSSYVRNYSSSGRSSASQTRSGSRSSGRTGDSNVRSRTSRSSSNPSFGRGSSSRSSYSSRSSGSSRSSYGRSSSGSSRGSYSRGSSSRSSYSRGSSSRSSYSRGSSSRGSSRSSYSRGSSSRGSSYSRGSSSRGSSSRGSMSRGSSSRSSGSRSSGSRSSSSRSGRGN